MTVATEIFDLIVVGGGIHGSAIAWEAVLRGYSVALIDKNDFSSGASHGNYRIIHGGLRYLQHFDLARLFESAEEQKIFRKIAPTALKPLPFLIPCYGFMMRGREILKLGLSLYDVLTFWRNLGVNKELHLPPNSLLSKDDLLKLAPHISSTGLRGGIVYFDAQMLDPDRLGLAFVTSASDRGAWVRNYTEVIASQLESKKITALSCRDTISGKEFSLRAKFIINATGAWRESVDRRLLPESSPNPQVFSKGLQLTLPKLTEVAIALESKYRDKNAVVSKGNRSYFLQPWKGKTIAGTADILHEGDPDSYRLDESEIALFLEELSQLYPDPRITREQVSSAFGGLRPVSPSVAKAYREGKVGRFGSIEVAHRDTVQTHLERGVSNLISVEGIKYTTTRRLAERVINLFESISGEVRGKSLSRITPLNYSAAPTEHSIESLKQIISKEFVRTKEDLLERRLGYGAFEPPSETLKELVDKAWEC